MLTGDEVTLRAPSLADGDRLFEIAAEFATFEERSTRPPRPLSRAEFDERFTRSITDDSGDVWFVIEVAGRVVGRCDLFHIDALARHAEVGIALHPSARGQGHGTDALRVLARFAFERRNLRRLHLAAIASNTGGLACYSKVGFVEEGRRREHAWVRGAYQDEVLMGLLRSEFDG